LAATMRIRQLGMPRQEVHRVLSALEPHVLAWPVRTVTLEVVSGRAGGFGQVGGRLRGGRCWPCSHYVRGACLSALDHNSEEQHRHPPCFHSRPPRAGCAPHTRCRVLWPSRGDGAGAVPHAGACAGAVQGCASLAQIWCAHGSAAAPLLSFSRAGDPVSAAHLPGTLQEMHFVEL